MDSVDTVLGLHEMVFVLSTNIDGVPINDYHPVDEIEYGKAQCSCGWISDVFVVNRVDVPEEMFDLHVREELKNRVYC